MATQRMQPVKRKWSTAPRPEHDAEGRPVLPCWHRWDHLIGWFCSDCQRPNKGHYAGVVVQPCCGREVVLQLRPRSEVP